MSEPTEDKKSHLSHALSLPLEEKNEKAIRKQQSLRIKPVSKPVAEESTAAPPIKDRSWSFGSVAKVVGCGVTAFGSGVVQGTKAVGSGVVQGTMVVGSGVIDGTKMAGKVTKDVTFAAGKGVFTAGEIVGSAAVSGVSAVGTATVNAGMAVGEASASAINDTTKWVREKRKEFEETDILPGQTLEAISDEHGVDVDLLILINELKSRNALSGKRILLPNAALKKSILERHEALEEFVVFITKFYKSDAEQRSLLPIDGISSVDLDLVLDEPSCPELLAPDVLEDMEEDAGDTEVGALEEKREFRVILSLSDTPDKLVYTINDENLYNSSKRLRLAQEIQPIIDAKDFGIIHLDEGCQPICRLPTLRSPSRVLSKDSIRRELYKYLPPQNQTEDWNLEYSTSSDGFSLMNLYRRLSTSTRDPVLLAIVDDCDAVFGVFLTAVPRQSEVFIGNGNSWLFSADGEEGTLSVYSWTGINEYFFKGDASHIMVGGGDGKFGLLIDGDLNKGRTDTCLTFNNQPLTTNQDFSIKCLEVWSFL
ncbi:TBC/LysMassociated domain containing 2 [Caligus rogercresseyi]|uniref:Oxidation resistance protein 1 n=1 Tax=Caligus rogercresseyi TaxID=217165 RepID=A0A7T8GTQ6_CALRO|nr:TBC/LysMassociated domain containing 2 [Caligus rogercresseyi]